MRNHHHKAWRLAVFFLLLGLSLWVENGLAQKGEASPQPVVLSETIQDFVRSLTLSVSRKAADMGFDYRDRPVIGVVVADFSGPAGEEIELGRFIGSELRAVLNRGNQFHVYGKEHPVSQSLKNMMTTDPQWSASSQRAYQQTLWRKFRPFPVDVVITGRVEKEAGNRIQVEVNLHPFHQPITQVEGESGRIDVRRERFLSPSLSAEELNRAMAAVIKPQVAKGRLVILSSLKIKRLKYPTLAVSATGAERRDKEELGLLVDTGKLLPLADLICWLDDRELTVSRDWKELKRKDYYNMLSGFDAEAFWFDDMVEEGRHSLFFGLVQNLSSKSYKTFSETFTVAGGTTNYLYFYLLTDSYGEPQIRVRQVVDPKNRPLPF